MQLASHEHSFSESTQDCPQSLLHDVQSYYQVISKSVYIATDFTDELITILPYQNYNIINTQKCSQLPRSSYIVSLLYVANFIGWLGSYDSTILSYNTVCIYYQLQHNINDHDNYVYSIEKLYSIYNSSSHTSYMLCG